MIIRVQKFRAFYYFKFCYRCTLIMSSYWKIDHRRKLNRSKLYEINIHINLDIYLVTTDKTKCIRNNHAFWCLLCQRSLLNACIISCSIGSGPGGENALYELCSIKDMILCFQTSSLNPSSSAAVFPTLVLAVNLETICRTKGTGCKSSVS